AGPDSDLTGLRVLVAGLGVQGLPVALHLAERGASVIAADDRDETELDERVELLKIFDADVRPGADLSAVRASFEQEDLDRLDLVVPTAGMPPTHPLLVAVHAAGVPVWGETEVAWRIRPERAAPWLAVTGTNG